MSDPCSALDGSVVHIRYLECIFGNVVGMFLGFAAIVLFIMLILGGFKFLTSGGKPESLESARNTLTYAIGGMILIALSFLILRFIQEFTGAEVTNFVIYRK
jgi:hypothetical protein